MSDWELKSKPIIDMILKKIVADNSWLAFIGLFIFIYTSDDTLLFGTNENSSFINAKYIIMALLSVIFLLKKMINRKQVVFFCVISFFFIINSAVTGWRFGFLYNLFVLFAALTYSANIPIDHFVNAFKKVISILGLCSIIIFAINLLYPSVVLYFPVYYNTFGHSFHHLYVSAIFDSLNFRNFGIFREPGVFAVYLNIALMIELFSKKQSMVRIIIYIVALMTTLSTSALLICAFIIGVFMVFSKKYKYSLLIFLLAGIVYYVITADEMIYSQFFAKIENQTISYYTRLSSLIVPIQMFINNPLGIGPESYNSLFPVISSRIYGIAIDPDSSTNTLLKFLAVYGVFIFAIYFKYLWRFCKYLFRENKLKQLFCLIVLVLCFSNEDMRSSLFFCLLIAYGVTFGIKEHKKYI